MPVCTQGVWDIYRSILENFTWHTVWPFFWLTAKKKKKKKKKPWSTSGKSHHVETVSLQRSDRDRALSLVRSVFLSDAEWTVTCSGCCLCVSQKISHSKWWMISKLDLPKCTVYSWLCLARFLKCLSAFIHTEKHTCVCSYTDKNSIHTHIH